MFRIGRGGLTRAERLRDQREQLASRGTPWVVTVGLLLLAATVWKQAATRVVANARLLLNPSFAPVWLILVLGSGATLFPCIRLTTVSARTDQERMDDFSADLVYRGELYFELRAGGGLIAPGAGWMGTAGHQRSRTRIFPKCWRGSSN
jgi:hypothetical protein